MIAAIIRNKENTLVLDLPHSIYDIYEKLQSIGIMQPPKRIPLTDNEDEDIGVKLFSGNGWLEVSSKRRPSDDAGRRPRKGCILLPSHREH